VFRKILVPVDFSPHSVAAVDVAAKLAKQLGARLRLVAVLDVGDLRVAVKAGLHDFKSDADVHRAVRDWIKEQFDRLIVPPDVPHTRGIRRGIVDQEILAVIRTWRPELVVMGSRGLSHRLPIGSKTAEVLRRSSVPVLIVTGK